MTSKSSGWSGRVCGLSFLILLSQSAMAPAAHAWGLSIDLNSGWVNSTLVNQVIRHREIDYCIEIQDPRFGESSIQTQVEAALALWLKPLESMAIQGVTIRQVSCDTPTFNLKVLIGPETIYTGLGSYQIAQQQNGHFYSLVKVDSGFLTTAPNGYQYPMVDFDIFVPNGVRLDSELSLISLENPTTTRDFAVRRSLDYTAVYESTYRAFIHEFGHSFGLCDTYDSQIHVHCDPAYLSATQPSSVMKDSLYFYLTTDDIAGIKALFARFMK